MKHSILFLTLLAAAPCLRALPVVSNVWAAQIPGTHQVRIEYDLVADAPCDIKVQFSLDGGANYGPSLDDTLIHEAMRKNVTAGNRAAGTQKSITLPVAELVNGVPAVRISELNNQFTKNLRFKVLATAGSNPPDSLVGCFYDPSFSPSPTLDNYAPAIISRLSRNEYGYGFSYSALAAGVANFRTKLAGNINTYIISRYLPSDVSLGDIDLSSSPAARLKSDGVTPNSSGYYYFSGPGVVRLAGTSAITSPRVILADGCDIYIAGNLSITGITGGGSLVIISRRVSGAGGAVHIHPQVSRIDATIIAEGALQNGTLTNGVVVRHDWVADAALLAQPLQIRGTLHSFNHRAGSLKPNPAGTGLVSVTSLAESRYFSPNTNTPAIPPDLESSRA